MRPDFIVRRYASYNAIVGLLSPIILLLRLLRIIKNASSFIYILMGTANLAVGVLGLFYVISAKSMLSVPIILLVLFLNILVGSFAYVDIFIRTLPGFTKKHP